MKIELERIYTELEHLKKTVEIIVRFSLIENWNDAERMGIGSALADVYKGYENIFRSLLEARGIKIPKSATWHVDILGCAFTQKLSPEEMRKTLKGMLAYRHMQVHGYGFMLKESELRQNAIDIANNFSIFEAHIKKIIESGNEN